MFSQSKYSGGESPGGRVSHSDVLDPVAPREGAYSALGEDGGWPPFPAGLDRFVQSSGKSSGPVHSVLREEFSSAGSGGPGLCPLAVNSGQHSPGLFQLGAASRRPPSSAGRGRRGCRAAPRTRPHSPWCRLFLRGFHSHRLPLGSDGNLRRGFPWPRPTGVLPYDMVSWAASWGALWESSEGGRGSCVGQERGAERGRSSPCGPRCLTAVHLTVAATSFSGRWSCQGCWLDSGRWAVALWQGWQWALPLQRGQELGRWGFL